MDKKNRPSVTMLLTEHKWDNIKDFDGNVQKLLLMYWDIIQEHIQKEKKMRCCGNCFYITHRHTSIDELTAYCRNHGRDTLANARCNEWRIFLYE